MHMQITHLTLTHYGACTSNLVMLSMSEFNVIFILRDKGGNLLAFNDFCTIVGLRVAEDNLI